MSYVTALCVILHRMTEALQTILQPILNIYKINRELMVHNLSLNLKKLS